MYSNAVVLSAVSFLIRQPVMLSCDAAATFGVAELSGQLRFYDSSYRLNITLVLS